MSWSRSIRAAAGIVTERTDEEVASAAEGRILALLTPVGWEQIRTQRLGLVSLEMLERAGWEAVSTLWEERGIEHALHD
ncbi:hypothetical protein GCM10009808_08590 [Microbacterium sediminicola]|uniref:Uncharacterized protein n=2 Tax=Microbacterium sediminicola TaxID=415210 RepID=A0ABN2HUJ1_9MICO